MNSILQYNLTVFFLIMLLAISCQELQDVYGFETNNCKIENEIDGETHFYELSCEEWDAEIDYGFGVYSQNETYTSEDYLINEKWKIFAIPKMNFEDSTKVDIDKIIDSIKVLSIDESLNAKLRYLGQDFDYKISIPPDIENFVEEKKVQEGITKRLIYDKESMKTFKYFLINNNNVSNGSPEAIVINLKSDRSLNMVEVRNILSNVSLP